MDAEDLTRGLELAQQLAENKEQATELRGRRVDIFDWMIDAGARPLRPKPAGELSTLFGIKVIPDPTMPPKTVDLRNAEGRILQRFIQTPDAKWIVVSGEVAEETAAAQRSAPRPHPG